MFSNARTTSTGSSEPAGRLDRDVAPRRRPRRTVADVSNPRYLTLGAGPELDQLVPDELLEGNITISFELRGEGRNVVRGEDQTTARFGIQCPELIESAKQYLNKVSGTNW